MLRGLSARISVGGRWVNAAAMNKQLTFCSPGAINSTTGATGPPSAAFSTWGALFAVAGTEIDRAQQIAQKVSHVAVIPYSLNVAENMTIQYIDGGSTRTFQIAAIDDDDEQRWMLKVYCFEINQNAGEAG